MLVPGFVFAGECRIYPGAALEEQATAEANKALPGAPGPRTTVYTSPDAFSDVVSFYRNVAREYQIPERAQGGTRRLPSGNVLDEAYFLFDGADNLMDSRLWVKVQRPYIGKVGAKDMETTFEDVRDVTMIIIVEKY